MSPLGLTARPLRHRHVARLAHRLRQADLDDLTTHAARPGDALHAGIREGEAYGVWDGDILIGAGGWTYAGIVWTLWADLTLSQYKGLMRRVPFWARFLAVRAHRRLENSYLQGNTTTRKWLAATRCVNFLDDQPLTWEGKTFIPFTLKPLEHLPDV